MGMLSSWIHQSHHLDSRWTEGVGDVLAGVLGPTNHIDFFTTQFIHDLLDARSAGADAGANGIDLTLDAVDGNFGAGADRARGGIGFPCHSHNAG